MISDANLVTSRYRMAILLLSANWLFDFVVRSAYVVPYISHEGL